MPRSARFLCALTFGSFALGLPFPVQANNSQTTAEIIQEGTEQSEIPVLAHELIDQIGPRLTNSTNMRRAEAWAVRKMTELGLTNVHKEGFEFGPGWDFVSADVTMISPRPLELTALPKAWTPATKGRIEAEIVVAPINNRDHFNAWRGKLNGKIVLIDLPGTGSKPTSAVFRRLDSSDISGRDKYELGQFDRADLERSISKPDFAADRDAFLASEGALAVIRISNRDGKLLHGTGYSFEANGHLQLPYVEMAAEDYRRLTRLAKSGPAPVLSMDIQAQFVDDDTKAYNILGEIPGTDPKAGYVMAGAHFDSWYAGDGAVDNGAGVVAILEAARILKALGYRPKRTIRFALWGAEEQGLIGSRAYAIRHLADRPGLEGLAPRALGKSWGTRFPIVKRSGFHAMKAYFNMDNGSGKIRGVHAEQNLAAESKLRKWFSEFSDLGAGSVVLGESKGTDHQIFQSLGLPAFQFIQDPLDYGSRLHHTNIDTYDHLQMEDLRQAATVMAGVLLAAANDPDGLPNEPLPRLPADTDPFRYDYPETE